MAFPGGPERSAAIATCASLPPMPRCLVSRAGEGSDRNGATRPLPGSPSRHIGTGLCVLRPFRRGSPVDQRQLVLPVGDNYFCRSHMVIIRYRRCRIGYGSASRITEAKTDGRKETTDGGGHGGDERAVGAEVAVAVWPVAVGNQAGAPVAHPSRSL